MDKDSDDSETAGKSSRDESLIELVTGVIVVRTLRTDSFSEGKPDDS